MKPLISSDNFFNLDSVAFFLFIIDGKIDGRFLFAGEPSIRFIIDSDQGQWFRASVEKLDSLLELLEYHLDPKKLPGNVTEVEYNFDINSVRWGSNTVISNGKKFQNY